MTRHLRAVSPAEPARALALLDELAALAPTLEREECLEAIGLTARLGAVLGARHLALAAAEGDRPAGEARLLDANAVAARLCLPVRTVYRLAREKRLASVRAGVGTVRFAPDDVERFIKSRRD